VPVDWSYQSFAPRIKKRRRFELVTPDIALSVVYHSKDELTGGKILFPFEFQVFCGKGTENCVLVWNGAQESSEGIIASLSPGNLGTAQLNSYDAHALSGYWPKLRGKDPLIRHLCFVPVQECNLSRMRIAVVNCV
jgi:hypothetical protein